VYNAGTLRLSRAILADNDAYTGGGIFNAGGVVELVESSLDGNSAGFGESRSTASAEFLGGLVREAARGTRNGKARAALSTESPAGPIGDGATGAAKVRWHGGDSVLRDGIRQIGRRS
jgi:hypothetical protein